MAKLNQKAKTARQFTHLLLELRDELRRHLQQKFRENNVSLTYEMHQVMVCLWAKDGIRQQDLEDKNDRRSKLIFLTNKGKELGKIAEPWLEELYKLASLKVTMNEMEESMKTVQKMIDNVKTG